MTQVAHKWKYSPENDSTLLLFTLKDRCHHVWLVWSFGNDDQNPNNLNDIFWGIFTKFGELKKKYYLKIC